MTWVVSNFIHHYVKVITYSQFVGVINELYSQCKADNSNPHASFLIVVTCQHVRFRDLLSNSTCYRSIQL